MLTRGNPSVGPNQAPDPGRSVGTGLATCGCTGVTAVDGLTAPGGVPPIHLGWTRGGRRNDLRGRPRLCGDRGLGWARAVPG